MKLRCDESGTTISSSGVRSGSPEPPTTFTSAFLVSSVQLLRFHRHVPWTWDPVLGFLPLLTLGCLHLRLSFSSCLKRSRPLGWLTSRRSWDARYVRNLTMIIFQNLSIPVTCTPYIAVLLMSLVVYRSARSCSTSPSHSLTVCTRFVVPA